MEKYTLKAKNSVYTIPKENIRMLAYIKMRDLKHKTLLDTDDQAIEYLKSIGIEVSDEDK